jgi:hypothetical protein
MPLSSDSMKMDAQYFRLDSNQDSSEDHANAIAAYVAFQLTLEGHSQLTSNLLSSLPAIKTGLPRAIAGRIL